MEFDPLARDAPPPRHDLESDSELSEEEEGEQGQAGPERTRSKAFVEPKVQVLGLSKKQATLIVAVGETGESLLVSTCPSLSESGSVLVDGEQEASVHVTAAATVVLLRPSHALSSKLASFPFVAAALLDALSPSRYVLSSIPMPSGSDMLMRRRVVSLSSTNTRPSSISPRTRGPRTTQSATSPRPSTPPTQR